MKTIYTLILIGTSFSSPIFCKTLHYIEILGKQNEFLSKWELNKLPNESTISGNTLLDQIFIVVKNGNTVKWKNKRKQYFYKN